MTQVNSSNQWLQSSTGLVALWASKRPKCAEESCWLNLKHVTGIVNENVIFTWTRLSITAGWFHRSPHALLAAIPWRRVGTCATARCDARGAYLAARRPRAEGTPLPVPYGTYISYTYAVFILIITRHANAKISWIIQGFAKFVFERFVLIYDINGNNT